MAVSRCRGYDEGGIARGVREAVRLLGLEKDFFRGRKVLVKPNLLGPFPPDQAVTTHPSVMKAVVDLVMDGGGVPLLAESPGGLYRSAARIFSVTGAAEVAELTGVPLVDLGNDELLTVKIGGRYYDSVALPRTFLEADLILSLPKFKTHSLTTFTGAVKNMFGIVPGNLKSGFHRKARSPERLAEAIVDLFAMARPHLSVMDAVVGMEGEGPSAGTPREMGYILAGRDAVALDAVCVGMMGLKQDAVPMIGIASQRGLGEGDLRRIELAGGTLEEMRQENFGLPKATYMETAINNWIFSVSTYDWLKPGVDDAACTGCSVCYDGCPAGAIEMIDNVPHFDYERCIRCYCCQELCPDHAIELKVDRSKKVILKAAGGVAKAGRLAREAFEKITGVPPRREGLKEPGGAEDRSDR